MNAPIHPHFERHSLIAAGRKSLNVVIAYDGIAAAQQAVDALDALKLRVPDGAVTVRISTWWFGFLEDAEKLKKATAAAIEADVLVIAANIGLELPSSVKAWLQESLAKNRKSDVAVVALPGKRDRKDKPDPPHIQVVQRIAREAGALFFAPFSNRDYRGRRT